MILDDDNFGNAISEIERHLPCYMSHDLETSSCYYVEQWDGIYYYGYKVFDYNTDTDILTKCTDKHYKKIELIGGLGRWWAKNKIEALYTWLLYESQHADSMEYSIRLKKRTEIIRDKYPEAFI